MPIHFTVKLGIFSGNVFRFQLGYGQYDDLFFFNYREYPFKNQGSRYGLLWSQFASAIFFYWTKAKIGTNPPKIYHVRGGG